MAIGFFEVSVPLDGELEKEPQRNKQKLVVKTSEEKSESESVDNFVDQFFQRFDKNRDGIVEKLQRTRWASVISIFQIDHTRSEADQGRSSSGGETASEQKPSAPRSYRSTFGRNAAFAWLLLPIDHTRDRFEGPMNVERVCSLNFAPTGRWTADRRSSVIRN